MKTYVLYQSDEEGSFTFFEKGDSRNQNALAKDARLIWEVTAKSWEIACNKRNAFLGYEPYKPMAETEEELKAFLPEDKHDVENFYLLKNLGYPQIEPILYNLFEWIQDMNWPIAQEIAPFLASLGKNVKPQIEKILSSNDGMWKYWVISQVIGKMDLKEFNEFKPLLNDLLNSLSKDDLENEVDLAVVEVLNRQS